MEGVEQLSGVTVKHERFVSEAMGDKAATELPGIGPAINTFIREQLKVSVDKEITAKMVYGVYLDNLEENKPKVDENGTALFIMWFMDKLHYNYKQHVNRTFKCLEEYHGIYGKR